MLLLSRAHRRRRRARNAGHGARSRSRISRVCVSGWQLFVCQVVEVLVALLRVSVLVLADCGVSWNLVSLRVVLIGSIAGGQFLAVAKVVLDVFVNLLVELFGLGVDLLPIGVAGISDVEDLLPGLELGRRCPPFWRRPRSVEVPGTVPHNSGSDPGGLSPGQGG